jgi:hypothetical protein
MNDFERSFYKPSKRSLPYIPRSFPFRRFAFNKDVNLIALLLFSVRLNCHAMDCSKNMFLIEHKSKTV